MQRGAFAYRWRCETNRHLKFWIASRCQRWIFPLLLSPCKTVQHSGYRFQRQAGAWQIFFICCATCGGTRLIPAVLSPPLIDGHLTPAHYQRRHFQEAKWQAEVHRIHVHLSLGCMCKLPGCVSPIHLSAVASDAAVAAWHAAISRRTINQSQTKHEHSLFLSWDQCAAVNWDTADRQVRNDWN